MGSSQSLPIEKELLNRTFGQKIEFSINGQIYKVGDEVGDMSLNEFIREIAHLKGTKFMCLEGGCGTCIVSAHYSHPVTHKKVTHGVNSCLVAVLACHGWEITTVEGIGNRNMGYNTVQKRLAGANGSQCGFCSPGMVMNMYSLLEQNPKMTMKEIENSFAGNICRCTGYRPILDAFKSFATDAPEDFKQRIIDIEDTVCPKNGQICSGQCNSSCDRICIEKIDVPKPLAFRFENGCQWYRPTFIKEIFEIFYMIENKRYRLLAGNTGQGVYRINPKPDVYIDVNAISELRGASVAYNGIHLGANITLTDTMDLFYKLAKEQPAKFAYCKGLADHIDLVAHIPVRNIGTLAGNLSLKHQYKEFPSDIFLIIETVGGKVNILDYSGTEICISLLEYLFYINMNKKIMTAILLPALNDKEYVIKTYKIMPRSQNAHAVVNAGFNFRFDKSGKYKILEKPTIVFGGIRPDFVHATKTEEYLTGRTLLDGAVLQKALAILSSELMPDHVLPDHTPEYRKGLAMSLFYKFVLSVNPDAVTSQYRSGGQLLERAVSSGKQDFDTNRAVWPLNKPVPKLEALIQSAGEAEYTNDIPYFPGQLWSQLVLCDRAVTEILSIDPSAALAIPGVIAFYAAKDIPGVNNFCPPRTIFLTEPEKVFAEGKTNYAGQAVGIIVAVNHNIAMEAADKVKIKYGKSDTIMIDVRKIIKDNVTSRIKELGRIEPTAKKDNVKYKVNGNFNVPDQYHFCMETLSCVAVPTEDSLDVYPSSQGPSILQDTLCHALNIPENKVNVRVRRLGGGFGCKITLPAQTAVACCLASIKLHRPVRLVVSLENGMTWGGKRFPAYADYEAGVDDNGVIQYMTVRIYQDNGYSANESPMMLTLAHLANCYDMSTWTVTGYGITTDSASNTWCRAPGSAEGTAIIENIMEHIARVTKMDPYKVRLANMTKDNPCIQISADIRSSSNYDDRLKEVEQFNKDNRWKKRGISVAVMEYPIATFGPYHGSVTIYRFDATVSISSGGVEMGQGSNTKAAQVAAYKLGIDLELVSVRPVDNFISPNNTFSGGSVTSESVCLAINKSCEELNERLKPVKEKLGPTAKWIDIITEAYAQNINLRAEYMFTPRDVSPYKIYGADVIEVECDILTGQFKVVRLDMIEDAGESLSPDIDVGQVEGAIVMGLGLYSSEELVYNEHGNLTNNRTWNYKPPGAKDIPIDMRITLRKKSSNPLGVLGSKATGEPPLCLTVSLIFALKNALISARQDAGVDDWPQLDLPYTIERVWLGALNSKEMFKL